MKRTAFHRILRSNAKGISLVDIMIALGLSMVVTIALISVVGDSNRLSEKDAGRVAIQTVREGILLSLLRYDSWQTTASLAGNLVLNCAKGNTNCPASVTAKPGNANPGIRLFDASGAIYFDGLDDATGFDFNGEACGTAAASSVFGKQSTKQCAQSPCATCPIRPIFTIKDICTTVACEPSQIKVIVDFLIWDKVRGVAVQASPKYSIYLLKNVY